jgi:hypothetical protein
LRGRDGRTCFHCPDQPRGPAACVELALPVLEEHSALADKLQAGAIKQVRAFAHHCEATHFTVPTVGNPVNVLRSTCA